MERKNKVKQNKDKRNYSTSITSDNMYSNSNNKQRLHLFFSSRIRRNYSNTNIFLL